MSSLFAGNYKTVFHGAWIEFEELRQYTFWEDVRNIDWLVSAKIWDTFVKKYEEERELEVLFILDIWETMFFGSEKKLKIDTLGEIFNILAFSCIKNNDKIWAIFFKNKIIKRFESKKWLSNLLSMVKYLASLKDLNNITSSNLDSTLEKLYLEKKKNSLIFILSDFTSELNSVYFKALAIKNDVIFINIFDIFEDNLSLSWIHNFSWNFSINLQNESKIEKYKALRKEKKAAFRKKILNYGWDYIEINNHSDIFSVLYKFFKSRQ